MDRPTRLRLFLLHSVLFPGQEIQLVVFEPRYHQLVRECLANDEPFGVALIREGPEVGGPATPYNVGTTARIKRAQPLLDGRVALEAIGESRFRIEATHTDQPYVSADVSFAADVAGSVMPARDLERVRAAYREVVRLRQAAAGEYERDIKVPSAPGALADAVGSLQLGSAAQRQRVLESDDPCTRAVRAGELLARALVGVQRQSERAIADRVRGPRLN